MKTKSILSTLSAIFGLVLIFAFTTGKKKQKYGDYVLVPAGSVVLNDTPVPLESFHISDHEITNAEYNAFLIDLQAKGKTAEYEICKIQDQHWTAVLGESGASLSGYYATHEAYADYPVLNISHEAALLYCKWLTEKLDDQNQMFRLPTKEEWVYAASGGQDASAYAWEGYSLRNGDGQFMCNLKRIGDAFIHTDTNNNLSVIPRDNSSSERMDFTAPSSSYWPNAFGLYNTFGNVSEMIETKGIAMGGSWNNTGYDVRITSEFHYDSPNTMVGFRPVRVKRSNQ